MLSGPAPRPPTLANIRDGQVYAVTLTNLTKQQVLTPPLLLSHKDSFKLFTLAQPANAEPAALAEGGNTQPLTALLGARDDVLDLVVASEPILPGSSITLEISSKGDFNYLSLASWWSPPTTVFFAINGSKLAKNGSRTLTAVAYDAGSDLSGPPCGAEGFAHVHKGIHGTADLNPATLAWHNPVVKIEITRSK
jgi:hypothetical protein